MPHLSIDVVGANERLHAKLDPEGVVIGRGDGCDLRLEDQKISKRHALIYRSPIGEWIVQDLQSINGVFVDGRKVQTQVLSPGSSIRIGPYVLRPVFASPLGNETAIAIKTAVADTIGANETIEVRHPESENLAHKHVRRMNEIGDVVSRLSQPTDLYPRLCAEVGEGTDAIVMVLRLPAAPSPLPEAPAVLAANSESSSVPAGPGKEQAFRFSRRVLDRARSGDDTVVARNRANHAGQMQLTIMAEAGPRTVVCAPIVRSEASVDVLYTDTPAAPWAPPSHTADPDFVTGIARLAKLVRNNLAAAEERVELQLHRRQLAMAREIQQKLLPADLPKDLGVDVSWRYEPAMWVGGDYCDVWQLADGRIVFAVGDVTGKGLPAAIVMATLHAALRTRTEQCTSVAEVTSYVNDYLRHHTPDGMFASMVLGFYDVETARLDYVNAGHLAPVCFDDENITVLADGTTNLLLGIQPFPFKAQTLSLEAGSGLLVMTDGATDALCPSKDRFEEAGVYAALRAAPKGSADEVAGALVQAVKAFAGPYPQQDDITVLAIRRPR